MSFKKPFSRHKLYCLFNISILFLFFSCQEVVDVDLDTASPKLVIEANIFWQKGTTGNNQRIKLTTTTNYYATTFPVVSGAVVNVKSGTSVFSFVEVPNTGIYECKNFVPEYNKTYTLEVVANGQTYSATETMTTVAPITKFVQKNDSGFAGDEIEVKAYYNDPSAEENYYLYNYLYTNSKKPEYYVSKDEFYNGNEFFSRSNKEDLKKGDVISINHIGISKQYFNYLSILIEIAGSSGGGPFSTPSATVKGNIVNKTNFDNYPLGYFALSEVEAKSYTVE